MSNLRLSEWMWRFLALAMLFTVGWMGWVLYQLNPPPLILDDAFRAFAKARAMAMGKDSPAPNATASGQITTPAAPVESPKPGVIAAAPAAELAKPAPEKPAAEVPVSTKPNPSEILDTLEGWARAWSTKDVAAYLAFYAPNFKTPGGESRAEWESSRKQRVSAPKSITISIDSPKISVVADDQVKVSFVQGYRSDILTGSSTNKTLVLIKADGRWLIQQEIADN